MNFSILNNFKDHRTSLKTQTNSHFEKYGILPTDRRKIISCVTVAVVADISEKATNFSLYLSIYLPPPPSSERGGPAGAARGR